MGSENPDEKSLLVCWNVFDSIFNFILHSTRRKSFMNEQNKRIVLPLKMEFLVFLKLIYFSALLQLVWST
jgi:hypothetical protein